MISGIQILPLRSFRDERGWFVEVRRESLLPHRTVQTNVSFSRRGVVRGLQYHERGHAACAVGHAPPRHQKIFVAPYVPDKHEHDRHQQVDERVGP